MTERSNYDDQNSPTGGVRKDSLGELLSKDSGSFPVRVSPWFVTRTAALAQETPQQGGIFACFDLSLPSLRWLIPLPLAGVAVAALFLIHQGFFFTPSKSFNSSESEFEQHMEMFASNDYSQ